LRYYATRKSCAELTTVENLYENLSRMKYSKRQMALYRRCSAAMLTFDRDLNDISDVYISTKDRNVEDNIFTSLEVLIKLYPNEHEMILYKLKRWKLIKS